MNTLEPNTKNSVNFPLAEIEKVIQNEDNIEFTLVTLESDSDFRYIYFSEGDTGKKVLYEKSVRIEISHEIEVVCEDWTPDENIAECNIDGVSFRKSAIEGSVDFNWERKLGNEWCDLPLDYIAHLDLEYASIEKLSFDQYYQDGKFLLVLNASYNDPKSEQTVGYYSGPFRFYCKKVRIIID